MGWNTIAKTDEILEGKSRAFIVEEKPIIVSKREGKFYAVDAICTHSMVYLPLGQTEDSTIICPKHFAGFDLCTGKLVRPISPDKTPGGIVPDLACYETKVEDGQIKVLLRT